MSFDDPRGPLEQSADLLGSTHRPQRGIPRALPGGNVGIEDIRKLPSEVFRYAQGPPNLDAGVLASDD
jgi:hypothetical protein